MCWNHRLDLFWCYRSSPFKRVDMATSSSIRRYTKRKLLSCSDETYKELQTNPFHVERETRFPSVKSRIQKVFKPPTPKTTSTKSRTPEFSPLPIVRTILSKKGAAMTVIPHTGFEIMQLKMPPNSSVTFRSKEDSSNLSSYLLAQQKSFEKLPSSMKKQRLQEVAINHSTNVTESFRKCQPFDPLRHLPTRPNLFSNDSDSSMGKKTFALNKSPLQESADFIGFESDRCDRQSKSRFLNPPSQFREAPSGFLSGTPDNAKGSFKLNYTNNDRLFSHFNGKVDSEKRNSVASVDPTTFDAFPTLVFGSKDEKRAKLPPNRPFKIVEKLFPQNANSVKKFLPGNRVQRLTSAVPVGKTSSLQGSTDETATIENSANCHYLFGSSLKANSTFYSKKTCNLPVTESKNVSFSSQISQTAFKTFRSVPLDSRSENFKCKGMGLEYQCKNSSMKGKLRPNFFNMSITWNKLPIAFVAVGDSDSRTLIPVFPDDALRDTDGSGQKFSRSTCDKPDGENYQFDYFLNTKISQMTLKDTTRARYSTKTNSCSNIFRRVMLRSSTIARNSMTKNARKKAVTEAKNSTCESVSFSKKQENQIDRTKESGVEGDPQTNSNKMGIGQTALKGNPSFQGFFLNQAAVSTLYKRKRKPSVHISSGKEIIRPTPPSQNPKLFPGILDQTKKNQQSSSLSKVCKRKANKTKLETSKYSNFPEKVHLEDCDDDDDDFVIMN